MSSIVHEGLGLSCVCFLARTVTTAAAAAVTLVEVGQGALHPGTASLVSLSFL